ncbi:conserved protein of unknown function [Tepidanaerobacter acetatoxydans Re1]|uniref:DUF192 domain-containing protein n=1 Tax=Tepidanaerobacter acetatoxydans (strain DSM 21804 / JCM 16047 / Re1) TaxID=1209989 RepID=F4LW42_TEPAE|nr:DUF192 domain-containing protein [Tepidanaerobacter acetatoxydans]AEE90818.1 protein of unknown function DUF192 [Tepidanaerobacter acetatoxydans Re1]CDI40450.1 conserved protein of unknown function [Tepidanaerobacter acetatoxydans Re1]
MKKQIIVGSNVMDIEIADSFLRRFIGLMLRAELPSNQGLLLSPCSSIHTCFMRFPIDVVYLDEKNIVLAKETMNPWKFGRRIKGTKKVLEGPIGFAENIKIGDALLSLNEHGQM